MIRRLEVLANIAVIVTSVVLCSVLAKKYFLTANKQTVAAATTGQSLSANAPAKSGLQAGMKVSLPGIEWSKSSRTVLLVLSTTCHFCTESVGFYGRMIKAASQKGLPVVLLFRKSEATRDVDRYVQENGLGYASAIPVDFSNVGIDGTPTLIFYRSKADAQLFAGKLSTQDEDRVLVAIRKL